MKTLMCALVLAATAPWMSAGWTPPSNPDPSAVLKEAEADTEAEHYDDALAKHVWFHENALKLQPSLYGVRLSFALSSWTRLAEVYPPALEKMKEVRDQAAAKVREGSEDTRARFHDFSSINESLGTERETRDLFVWLDQNKPAVAKAVFDLARPALIKAKEYRIAGRYIDPAVDFKRLQSEFQEMVANKGKSDVPEKLQAFAENRFSNGAATLVALLVVNDRKFEAAQIAEAASREWNSQEFQDLLKQAWEGHVPDPWP